MILLYKPPTLSFCGHLKQEWIFSSSHSHVTNYSVSGVQGLAELKELAGVDKDIDEEEDLGLLEQEASMPLHELLAKMKEVCNLRFESHQRGNTAHSLCSSVSNLQAFFCQKKVITFSFRLMSGAKRS